MRRVTILDVQGVLKKHFGVENKDLAGEKQSLERIVSQMQAIHQELNGAEWIVPRSIAMAIRDSDAVYLPERRGSAGKLFGIDLGERNFSRLRLA